MKSAQLHPVSEVYISKYTLTSQFITSTQQMINWSVFYPQIKKRKEEISKFSRQWFQKVAWALRDDYRLAGGGSIQRITSSVWIAVWWLADHCCNQHSLSESLKILEPGLKGLMWLSMMEPLNYFDSSRFPSLLIHRLCLCAYRPKQISDRRETLIYL